MKSSSFIRSVAYYWIGLVCSVEQSQLLQSQMTIKNIIDKEFSNTKYEVSINDIYVLIRFCDQFYEHGVCTMEYIQKFYYDYTKKSSSFEIDAKFIHLLGIFSLLVLNEEINNTDFKRNFKYLIIRYFGNDLLEISNRFDINLDDGINVYDYKERLDYLLNLLFNKEFNKRIKTYISDLRTRMKTEMLFKNLVLDFDVKTPI